jgi:peroxiredoxin Q/BCP
MKAIRTAMTVAAALSAVAVPALAALAVGVKAPDFTIPATLDGHQFTFSLADALKKGPVVLYFYPAAFTSGCTAEAHAFAGAMGKFKALHATVIGVSHDTIATLDKFSVSECQGKFPVAADPDLKVARDYQATLAFKFANRTSYVIAPDGQVAYTYTNLNPAEHVDNTLAAVKAVEAKPTV